MTTDYLPLACFGKLPFWREYLEIGPAHPTSRSIKDWLHRGREELGLESGEEGAKDHSFSAHLRVMVGLPGSRELLAGVIRPSRDAGGRHYPFALFTHFPRKVYGRHYPLLPLALVPVWEALDDAWDSLAAAPSRPAFEEMLSSYEAPGLAEVAAARGDYEGRKREDAARLVESGEGASLESLNGKLSEIVAGLRESGGKDLRAQLPVARDLQEACFNAGLWIDLVNRQFRLRRFEPSVLLDAGPRDGSRRLFLKFGALEPADYVSVVGPRTGGEPARPAVEFDPAAAEAASPDLTYAELLETRCGKGR